MPGVHILKYIKKNTYGMAAAAIIAFAVGLRVILLALHWPPTNGDEGVMATMAYNIAYHGEHPTIFYGQDYMGDIEAYLGALFFHLFGGPSLMALRLGVVLMVGLFFVCMYWLTSLLFSKKLALVTLGLLSVGSIPYLTRQTIATGGSSQTLLFGSLAFLIAVWLALTYRRRVSARVRLLRLPMYGAFGVVAGLGMWSDMIVLPFLAMAGMLILVFCWRELLIWGGWLLAGVGVLIGLFPSLWFSMGRGLNPFVTLFNLAHGSGEDPLATVGLWHNIVETVQVTIPTATGFPFCPVIEYPFLGDNTPRTLQCGIVQTAWGGGYLLLILTALIFTLLLLQRFIRDKQTFTEEERHRLLVSRISQLLMVGAAIGVIAVFIRSTGPFNQPGYHARYLIGLLIILPALIDPLWSAASKLHSQAFWQRVRSYSSRVILAAVAVILVTGTVIAFSEVPKAQVSDAQRTDLVAQLEHLGVKHLYTDYWSCYSLVFASKENIICGVINHHLNPSHNRYPPFYTIVHQDKEASWMCPKDPNLTTTEYDCLDWLDKRMAKQPPGKYKRYEIDNYVLYRYMPK
ncbi:ArnT family glycosyltransferase [Dictyobacter formicarum]|uniref:Glycosyltransferase RgtA/B/C/D-like domain-containing protein n=1 Tax=Dictyobacter formicarum TaxID=2778368 RepID=A0ABQ3VH55_9CHLR|nr:hypothetical protein [Dictyobacter formicarum]GHO84791.1 hypothetical protein KSZ_27970 [Dictyobacter formicarum]